MIYRSFKKPHEYEYTVLGASGNNISDMDVPAYFESEASLREYLEKKFNLNRHKCSISIKPTHFKKWKEKAEKATKATIDAYRRHDFPIQFNSEIWKDFKKYLLDLFEGKCAYCESKLLHTSYGEVEHYRPRKKVEEHSEHKGYYWLAYDIENLLPCCSLCNQKKACHFPVENGYAETHEEDINKEKPLLLHPYRDKPEKYLEFRSNGIVVGKKKKGIKSVAVYNLNRTKLVTKRREKIKSLRKDFSIAFMLCLEIDGDFSKFEEMPEFMMEIKSGKAEFSMALRQQIELYEKQLNRSFENFRTNSS